MVPLSLAPVVVSGEGEQVAPLSLVPVAELALPLLAAGSAQMVALLDLLGRTGAEPGYPSVSPLVLVPLWADQAPLDAL